MWGGWSLHKHRASWPSTPSTRPLTSSAGPSTPSTGPSPPSTEPSPPNLQPTPQLPPPNPQLPPLNQLDTGAHPVDDPNNNLYDDPYTNDNGPLSAPLGNALDVLDGDVNMYNDDNNNNGVEYNSSRRHVVSSPPKVVGHKWQYAASPSPPPVQTNAFVLPWKPQTLAYHSHVAFGSASPGSQVPCRPPSFTSSSGISCSCSTPSSTASSSYLLTDYQILPMASQTSLSAKPQSLASSKKKRTLATDIEGHLSMLNDEIRSMQSDIRRNFSSAEAKAKEILHLQAAAALQEKEAETWCLKIQYETMIHASPLTSSPSV
ncbi:uncharacterized protein BJ212DRAFT_1482046 [Suillus subaureus]|uniref:Uncharacterized protein n=1 Tax=Suillus subaureus TaxID=48587 RepID=A0A9P7E903_9AGAM|nr:uncharacterized protein BJ212DRAFT_1482046 [Suillus subaureus]KAG1814301.1 hypothetical protein BJ212DRAFT_1482046 [Suillus subaureus]